MSLHFVCLPSIAIIGAGSIISKDPTFRSRNYGPLKTVNIFNDSGIYLIRMRFTYMVGEVADVDMKVMLGLERMWRDTWLSILVKQ